MPDIFPEVVISNRSLPVYSIDVHSGTYGSVGHAEFTTSRTALDAVGIQLIQDATQLPGSLPLDIYCTLGSSRYHIFGGEYVSGKWRYDRDSILVHARDWAGVLVDQKRILSSVAGAITGALAPGQVSGAGVETQNQKLSQIVTQIAQQFGLTPVLFLGGSGVGSAGSTGGSTSGFDPTMGTLYGSSDQVYWPMPSSMWGILNKLARDTGNEVYVTPDKQLVFGLPGAGLAPITISYQLNPPPDGAYPCMDLQIEHNPRRNLTFRVLVLSYDPAKAQITQGSAVVIGTNVNTNDGQTIQSGMWSGTDATKVGNQLSATQQDSSIPLYTIRIDGLTQDQAQQQALSIARDIAKRELIVTCKTDGILQVLPMNPVTLTSTTVDPEFLAHQYWANAYKHSFRMSKTGNERAEFSTELTLLDLQLSGVGDSVTTGSGATKLSTTGQLSSLGQTGH